MPKSTSSQETSKSGPLVDSEYCPPAELKNASSMRCSDMSIGSSTCVQTDIPHPPWFTEGGTDSRQLETAIATLRRVVSDDIGLDDEEFATFLAARRLMFGSSCGFVAAHDRELSALGTLQVQLAAFGIGEHGGITQAEREFLLGIRLVGKFQLASLGTSLTLKDATNALCGSRGECVETTNEGGKPPTPNNLSGAEIPTQPLSAPHATEVVALSVAKFARRWDFGKRQIETYIRRGLPRCGEGKGRRIPIAEGDDWMRNHQDPLAKRAAAAARRHTQSRGET